MTSEYEALRQEMSQRVQMIHTASFAGLTGVLAAIGFGLAQTQASPSGTNINAGQMAFLIQVFLILLTLYIRELYARLYWIGTYIAFTYEANAPLGTRWHRMSRHFSEFQRDEDKNEANKPRWTSSEWWGRFVLERPVRWGTGAKLTGSALFFVTVVNWFALIRPRTELHLALSAVKTIETWAVVLAVLTLCSALPLLFGLERYLKRLERDWCSYHQKFGMSKYARHYDPVDSPAGAASRDATLNRAESDGRTNG